MKIKATFEDLAPYLMRFNIGPYEWRVLTCLLVSLKTNGADSACMRLEDFQHKTGVSVYHVSRALKNLRARNILNVMIYKNEHYYSVDTDATKWRSYITEEKEMSPETEKRFDNWFEHYPRQFYREDARMLYIAEINSGVDPDDLDAALVGYAKMMRARAERTKKEVNFDYLMYPTSFLRNGRWRTFLENKGA